MRLVSKFQASYSSAKMNLCLRTLLTLLTFLVATSGWRPFTVDLRDLSYEVLHREILDLNLTMKNRTHIDVDIYFVRAIPQAFIDLTVLHDSGGEKFDMVYMNRTVDLCQFLTNKKSNIFFDIVFKVMTDYSDTPLPQRCPILKKKYQLLNTFLDAEKFPPIMPDHKAKALIVGWVKENGVKIILLKMNFKVVIQRTYKNVKV